MPLQLATYTLSPQAIFSLMRALALASCLLGGLTSSALAEEATQQWYDVLCVLAGFADTNLGKGLATIGVMIVAVGAIFGKVSWGLAVTVSVGIAGLFNAPEIADAIVPIARDCT